VVLREGGSVDLGTIVVREGQSMGGTVTNDIGDPIPGAEVGAMIEREGRFIRRVVRTGATGEYRLSGLGEEPVHLSVSAEGHGGERRPEVLPGAKDVDFVLQRNGSVVGRVVVEGGGIPSAFEVRSYLEAEADQQQGGFRQFSRLRGSDAGPFSNPDGSFTVDDVAPGTYTVEARAQGLAPGKVTGVRVVSAAITDAGPIVLERGMTIRGRVLAAGDDTPVTGAAVTVAVPSTIGFRFEPPGLGDATITGGDGLFVVEGVAAGAHTVSVEHPDYSRAESRVAVKDGVDLPEVVVRLSKGGTITGTVRDADGEPVPDDRIMLLRGPGGDVRTAATGADGRYAFERVTPATYYVSRMGERGGFAATGMKSATVEEGRTVVVDFGDPPAVRLEGLVLRGDERVAGATLYFTRDGGGAGFEARSALSDAGGSYEVGLPGGGTYGVTVQTGRRGRFGGGIGVVLTVPDEPEVTRDIVLATSGFAGTVTDAGGQAVRGAMVVVEHAVIDPAAAGEERVTGAATDPSGAYVVEGLEAGSYRVTVSAPGFSPAERSVDVSDAEVTPGIDFRLAPGRMLRGRVVDPAGRGLADAFVVVLGAPARDTSMTDVNGAFTVTAPSEGPVDVGVYAAGWAPAWRSGIVPREGEQTTIVVSPGGTIEIRLRGSDGRPVSGIQVQIAPLGGAFPRTSMVFSTRQPPPTGPDGVAVADLLAPGAYEIQLPGRDVAPAQVTVTEGGTSPVVLTVP
jgi:protocatechuate 3,4-dioxygenase beta subunit